MIKVVVPNMMMNVLDRVIQSLGAMGVSDDTPVAAMWRYGRSMRLADSRIAALRHSLYRDHPRRPSLIVLLVVF